jgi:hypothetical protein
MGSRRSNSIDTDTKPVCCQSFHSNRISGTKIGSSGQRGQIWPKNDVATAGQQPAYEEFHHIGPKKCAYRNLTGSPALGHWLSDGMPEITEDDENQPRTDQPS